MILRTRLTLTAALFISSIPLSAYAQTVEVTNAVYSDQLSSLKSISPSSTGVTFTGDNKRAKPLPQLDAPGRITDTAIQSSVINNPAASTTAGLGFDGVGLGFTGPQGSFTVQSAPPDTTGAVGATQYVQWVNSSFAVFDKTTGNVVYGPVAGNTLWKGFGGACEAQNDGDPVVLYDKLADRWVLMQFAVPTGGPYYQCVAVSQTSDATGAYNRYAFQYSAFNDYPKGGVWPDAYYVTFNMFGGRHQAFSGAKICAYDRAKMLQGQLATQQCVQLSSTYGGVLPADLDGKTLPPAGAPNYLVNKGSSALNLWKFHVGYLCPTPKNVKLAQTSV